MKRLERDQHAGVGRSASNQGQTGADNFKQSRGLTMSNYLETLSDDELNRMEENIRKAPSTFRGRFTLQDILAEKRRRLGRFAKAYDQLLDAVRQSPDGRITYGEVFAIFFPNEVWHFRRSMQKIKALMDGIIQYAVAFGKPILTAAIVRSGSRKCTPRAKQNIFDRSRDLGYSPAFSAEALADLERGKIGNLLI